MEGGKTVKNKDTKTKITAVWKNILKWGETNKKKIQQENCP